MATTIEELRNQLKAMFDKTENKTEVAQIGTLNSLVDKLEAEHNQIQNEQKDLLKDYKELIKHTSFAPNGTEQTEVPEQKELTFGDFLGSYQKQKNN